MLNKNKLVLLLIILMLICTGCSTSTSNQESKSDMASYFPAQPGLVFKFVGTGNEFAAFTREVKFRQDNLVQIHDDNGGTVMANVYKVTSEEIVKLAEKPESYEDKNLLSKVKQNPQLQEVILKRPLKPGTSWTADDKKYKITAVKEEITAPAGEFHDVIEVQVTPMAKDRRFENYNYYAKNVGLIKRKSIAGEQIIKSELKSWSRAETDGKDKSAVNLSAPALMAYQLYHQAESSFQAAYETFINMSRITEPKQTNFQQISRVLTANLEPIATEKVIEEYTDRLQEYYRGGEGELTFPTHEVVHKVEVLTRTEDRLRVKFRLEKYYPQREWNQQAYHYPVNCQLELVKRATGWKLKQIITE